MSKPLMTVGLALVCVVTTSVLAEGDDVILHPGTLSGSVSIAGRSITSIIVYAVDTSGVYSGTTGVSVQSPASSIDYVITIEGGRDYYVLADAVVSATEWTRAVLPVAGPVHVPVRGDVSLDMAMVPAVISGTISTGSANNTIENYWIMAYVTAPMFDEYPHNPYTSASRLSIPGDVGTNYTLLLAPEVECYVYAAINVDGLTYRFYDYDVTAPPAGVVANRDYLIDVTDATVSGTAILQGIDVTVASMYGFAESPSRQATAQIVDITSGLYTLPVDAGTWYLQPEFVFHSPGPLGDSWGMLTLSPSRPLEIGAGDQLTGVDFIVSPGFIPGTLSLWGANTKFCHAGLEAQEANGGHTAGDAALDSGEFLLVCSPGDWRVDYKQDLSFTYDDDPDIYLYSTVSQYYGGEPQMRTVAAGQTAPQVDLTFGTILVRRYFHVAGGGTLSSPSIRAVRHGQPYSEARGDNSLSDVIEGQAVVTLLLPGTYTIEAFAYVNDSYTEFAPVEITVNSGDTVVIGDMTHPTLTVTSPVNGQTICGDRVTVEGTVADDRGIASIKINGRDVAFDPAENPAHFSHEISLTSGENQIEIVVTDVDQTQPVSLTLTVISTSCGGYRLTITSDDGGSVVVPGEGEFTYESARTIPIEAEAADARYRFARWTGTAVDGGKVADPGSAGTAVRVDGVYTLRANFSSGRVVLTTSSSKGGSVTTPGEGTFEYDPGALVLVQATPDDQNHYFTHWAGTAVEAGKVGNRFAASTSVTMDADYSLEAHFAAYRCGLALSSTKGGHVNVVMTEDNVSRAWLGDKTYTFDSGTELTLLAFAEPGYRFSHWSGTVWSTANRLVFPIVEDCTLIGNFVPAP